MTLTEPAPRVPLRHARAWVALVVGVVLVGIGLGLMIDADFGVAPADALFTGLSRTSGLSVGTVLVLASILMVLMSWALGLRPAVGTLVAFIGIAVIVDLTRLVISPLDVPEWAVGTRIAVWIVGLLAFCTGVLGIFASDLGASPYDQVVRSIAYRTGRSLGFARLVVDAIALLGGIVLGGSWGLGTVIILIAVPAALNLVLPRVRRHVQAAPPILVE